MGAWIEILQPPPISISVMSHPTMGAWIEIVYLLKTLNHVQVAPHDGCVDWNNLSCGTDG